MTGAVLAPGTAALVLFGMFFGLLALRVPVAFALGLAALPILLIEPRLSAYTLVQETFNAYNSFILLAVPFYLLAANLMNVGGITDRLVRLSRALVGHMPSMGEVAARLIGAQAPLAFKKGATCCIETDALPPAGVGQLRWFVPPRALRALGH